VVLVTGDGDLLPGMMSAKEHGVAVHLWAVQAADGDYNQSEDLVAEADERRVLDREWIIRAIRAREVAGACAPPSPRPEIAAILSAPLPDAARGPAEPASAEAPAASKNGAATVEQAPAGPGGRIVPTPKDLAALRAPHPAAAPSASSAASAAPSATLRWSSDKGMVGAPDTAESHFPMLAQLTTAEQRWADREEDITTVSGDPFEVGQVFARRWTARLADPVLVQQLSVEYPRVPHRIDGELLRYAARFGLLAHKDDQIDEHDRYAIRAGFWREIDARTAAEHTAAPAAD
jgi:hypothetical protein